MTRKVGGSGWAGVHGSFIGIAKSGQPRAQGRQSRKRLQEACSARVKRIEDKIQKTKELLGQLKNELRVAEKARQKAFKVVNSAKEDVR